MRKNKLNTIIKLIFNRFNKDKRKGFSRLDVLTSFPLYRPYGTGDYKKLAELTIIGINCLPKALLRLSDHNDRKIYKIEELIKNQDDLNKAAKVKEAFDNYGSDKANPHNYHILYSYIFNNTSDIKNIFEIGLGSKNKSIVSHMRKSGRIGGSLKAFSSLFPDAKIWGADFDKEILFTEKNIKTFYVDQNQRDSFLALDSLLPMEFDLMIDDGLHAIHANLHSLEFFLKKIKCGGWIIIEDISIQSIDAWYVVQGMLSKKYLSRIYQSNCGSIIFAVQKKQNSDF